MSLLSNDIPVRAFGRSLSPAPAHWEAAQERVMSDMDTLTDWLAGECMRTTCAESQWIERNSYLMPDRMQQASIADLLHLVLTTCDSQALRIARDTLVQRYLTAQTTYIEMEADSILGEA